MSTHWSTKLIHPTTHASREFESLVVPTYRGSTTVFANAAAANEDWRQEAGYTYGLYGTPTTRELAVQLCALEGGYRTFLVPGGQAAIALIHMSFASAGDHVLVPDSAYGPNRGLAEDVLRRFGVEVEFYPPMIGAGIARLLRPNTRLVWCESPGSVTMEVQDLPAIVAAAHRAGAVVALDNTWSAGVLLDAFAHGVDVTMQALTKFVGGHSDLLLGSVTVRDAAGYEKVGLVHERLGYHASPDDCALALRGLQTLAVRLAALERNALHVARWLDGRDEVERVLHPALPSSPGHEHWRRDFTGSSSVFSIVLREGTTRDQVCAFVDALELFAIGYSWGGVTSLAMPFFDLPRNFETFARERLVRLNIGLEDPGDLVKDLERGMKVLVREETAFG